MEDLKIEEFVSHENRYGAGPGAGFGYAAGDGLGDGHGLGDGDGDGDGYGHGSGDCYGDCYGNGYGSGEGCRSGDGFGRGSVNSTIKSLNAEKVFPIDNTPTIIRYVRGDIAKGAIINLDLSLTNCFVVKQDGLFAHGETLAKAMAALRDKLVEGMSDQERIDAFRAEHEPLTVYPIMDFFDWHHKLTGSCEMGRKAFAQRHGLDLSGEMTVEEFIKLTENDYGGDVIKKLKPLYGM